MVDDDDFPPAFGNRMIQEFPGEMPSRRHPELFHFRIVIENGPGPVGRIVVTGDDFDVMPVLREERSQCSADPLFVVSRGNNDADHVQTFPELQ